MRRAQSVRHYARPSLALGADDLGMLREGNESNEDVLRRQLIDKDRENDRLQSMVQTLQDQLAQRPPLETIQELEREHKNLDLLLQGTQRENERCMAELERAKTREKMLERELTKLVGDNWQASLDIAPAPSARSGGLMHQRTNTLAGSPHLGSSSTGPTSIAEQPPQATSARIEQIRMLILGMEQRLEIREDKLLKFVEKAETEGHRFEQLHKEISTNN